jgi:hypothetical protein
MATGSNRTLVITKEIVEEHLIDMGYNPKSLSKESIDNFVKELQEMYDAGEFENLDDESNDEDLDIEAKSDKKSSAMSNIEQSSKVERRAIDLEVPKEDNYVNDISSIVGYQMGHPGQESSLKLHDWEKELEDMTESELLERLEELKLKSISRSSSPVSFISDQRRYQPSEYPTTHKSFSLRASTGCINQFT